MKKFLLPVLLGAVLFASCAGKPARRVLNPTGIPEIAETPRPYIITDYKNKTSGESIPGWVSRYLEGGVREVETLDVYQDRYVFVGRSRGNRLNALNQWAEGFSAELDFPRLAAVRIEARFSSGTRYPDEEYGAFFETLIRAASDAPWTGAVREDDFWLRLEFLPREDPVSGEDTVPYEEVQERETWEFLILVTMGKSLFASQLDTVFRSINPTPSPTGNQATAANQVKDRFFDGF